MKSVYELKRFKKSKDEDLVKALHIYSSNIEPIVKTDTREIIHWLDEYPKRFEDKFFVLGFYLNDRLIGYSQFAYFIEEKLVFVDYIVIDKDYRRQNTFYQFTDEIKQFMEREKIEYNYIVAEVGGFDTYMEPTETTRGMIRLLKMLGFGVIKTTYFHPRLGKTNYESELQSVLMLFTGNDLKSIRKQTYFLFLETIYFKHYNRWYNEFLNKKEIEDYKIELSRLIELCRKELKSKEQIEVNGHPNSYASGNKYVAPGYKQIAKSIAVLLIFIFFILGFGIIHNIVKTKFGIDTSAQTTIIIAAGIAVLFILSLFAEGKTSTLSKVIEKLLTKLTG